MTNGRFCVKGRIVESDQSSFFVLTDGHFSGITSHDKVTIGQLPLFQWREAYASIWKKDRPTPSCHFDSQRFAADTIGVRFLEHTSKLRHFVLSAG
jgi:hypothetical protein